MADKKKAPKKPRVLDFSFLSIFLIIVLSIVALLILIPFVYKADNTNNKNSEKLTMLAEAYLNLYEENQILLEEENGEIVAVSETGDSIAPESQPDTSLEMSACNTSQLIDTNISSFVIPCGWHSVVVTGGGLTPTDAPFIKSTVSEEPITIFENTDAFSTKSVIINAVIYNRGSESFVEDPMGDFLSEFSGTTAPVTNSNGIEFTKISNPDGVVDSPSQGSFLAQLETDERVIFVTILDFVDDLSKAEAVMQSFSWK